MRIPLGRPGLVYFYSFGVVIVATCLALRRILVLLQSDMGTSGSKHDQAWQSSPPSGAKERLYSKSGYDITPFTTAQIEAAASNLTEFQRQVALQSGTERAFTGRTVDGAPYDEKRPGLYVGSVGGLPLFRSEQKYDSGTGWPSFWAPIDPDHIIEKQDFSIPFMPRIEVLDARSGAHLGHVFNDGPKPSGKRYCMNAAALRFIPDGDPLPPESKPSKGE